MSDSSAKPSAAASTAQDRAFDLTAAKSKLEPILRAAAPAMVAAGRALDTLSPYISLVAQFLVHVWGWLQPYHPEVISLPPSPFPVEPYLPRTAPRRPSGHPPRHVQAPPSPSSPQHQESLHRYTRAARALGCDFKPCGLGAA